MLISKNFDSGSIEVVDATDPRDVRLAILRDHPSEWFQWFHFRASGVMDESCKFTIDNDDASTAVAVSLWIEGWS